jgi:DNA-binding CsgD family transcriptional regulator
VRARWADTGATEVVVGAAPLGPAGSGRYMIVELGITDTPPAAATADAHGAPAGAEEAAVLDAILPVLARQAASAFGLSPFSEATCLTRREVQVLEHLLFGRSVKQIAEQLGRSQHTVHDHVKALHRKLAAISRGALIARALGYLGPDGNTANGPLLGDFDAHN